MNKENIKLLYIQTIDSIDTIYHNHFYDDIYQIKKIRVILKSWYKDFEQTYNLLGIKVNDILFLDIEINNYINNYSNINIYLQRLFYDFNLLKEEWQNQMIKKFLS